MEELDALIGPPQKHFDNISIFVPFSATFIAGFSLTGEGGVPKQFLQMGPFSASMCCEASAPMQISWTIESQREQMFERSSFWTGSKQQTQLCGAGSDPFVVVSTSFSSVLSVSWQSGQDIFVIIPWEQVSRGFELNCGMGENGKRFGCLVGGRE